jgi:uncharacterized protein YkwD
MKWVMPARPAVLATLAVALLCATPLTGTAVSQGDGRTPPPPIRVSQAAPASALQIENALLAEMNRVRLSRGRVALRHLSTLRRPAREQSRFLLRIGDLRHESSDGSPFWTRLVEAGFPRTRLMAENLSMVSGCEIGAARRTVAMWMGSPGHRANMLNPRFRWTGVGAAVAGDCSATYLTADYGS